MATNGGLFRKYLDRSGKRVDRTLKRYLPRANLRPRIIHRAMRYTALSEGKRLRPALVILAYEASGGVEFRRTDVVVPAGKSFGNLRLVSTPFSFKTTRSA